jgi:hypothetical protein
MALKKRREKLKKTVEIQMYIVSAPIRDAS